MYFDVMNMSTKDSNTEKAQPPQHAHNAHAGTPKYQMKGEKKRIFKNKPSRETIPATSFKQSRTVLKPKPIPGCQSIIAP